MSEENKILEYREPDPLEILKKERLEEINGMLEGLEEGMEVRIDGGRWRKFLKFRLCDHPSSFEYGCVTYLVLEDALWDEVDVDVHMLTEVRDRRNHE